MNNRRIVFSENDLLPISALQHLLFCERQCALIHIEQIWIDNALTTQGTQLHQRVDEGPDESRGDVRTARGVRLRSLRLGIVGRADAVEFHRLDSRDGEPDKGTALPEVDGHWRPFPVEYKRGKPKRDRSDEVQLCAQALCLEEMMETEVPAGALFYGTRRRRTDVPFDEGLRAATRGAAARLRELIESGVTPPARREPKCEKCSLLQVCMPDALSHRSAAGYLDRALADAAS